MSSDGPVPVTLLAGFLGSGKTTLVNRILAEPHGERIAVVVNEFGDVGIDGSLVVGVQDEVVELRNGCICCTVRSDLAETLADLLERRRRRFLGKTRFDRVLVEASGLASPGPALQTLQIDPRLQDRLVAGQVITLAHAALLSMQVAEHPEAGEQLAYADKILLNHVDRAAAEGAALQASAEAAARRCNPLAPIELCTYANRPIAELLSTPRLERVPDLEQAGLVGAAHTHGLSAVSFSSEGPLDLHRLKMWLQFVAAGRSHEVMRLKGILRCTGLQQPVVAQGVYQFLQIGPGEMELPDVSRLVLIGRNLDVATLERGWNTCSAGAPA